MELLLVLTAVMLGVIFLVAAVKLVGLAAVGIASFLWENSIGITVLAVAAVVWMAYAIAGG